LQEVFSAPPSQDIPTPSVQIHEDTHTNEMECEVDVSLPAPFCDVGVQVTPSKKNARVQARPKSISVGENSLLLRRSLIVDVNSLYISGIQVNIEPKMKDAQI